MSTLLAKALWRDRILTLVDFCGARATRAQRRARLFTVVLRLRRARFRLLDTLLPARRAALAVRRRARQVLADMPRDRSLPVVYRVPPGAAAAGELAGLRLGIFIPSFLRGPGGAEKVAGQLADVAATAGARVTVLCRPPADADALYALNRSIRLAYVNELADADIRRLGTRPFDLLVCFGMAHFYRRIPHIAALLETPYVVQECTNPDLLVRQLEQLTDAASLLDAASLREAVLAHARGVRVTSPLYEAGLPSTIRPFVYAFYNAFRMPPGPGGGPRPPRRKFICVGALKNANKNGLAALEGFCAFAARHPEWQLVFYGENNYAREVARILKRYPGADVRDAGTVRDIGEIYADAHALLIPSFEEGLPNVVVEAFSFGVPCIGFSDCAAVAHLVRPGVTGILADRSDPRSIEKALEASTDLEFRERLARGARAFAAEHFAFATWTGNWMTLLCNAAAGRDKDGVARKPAAHDDASGEAAAWRKLLATYRPVA